MFIVANNQSTPNLLNKKRKL